MSEKKSFKVMVIEGPNLNMLGIREQNIYGTATIDQIHEAMKETAKQNNIKLEFFQSNLEGEIIDKVQESLGEVDGIVINPAAYTHTSIAIKDAISAVNLPTVEVHLSNIYKREPYRRKSITAEASTGVISGFGPMGYHLAIISLSQIFITNDMAKKGDKK
ncbi:MAG: type II 3-dehydroquinate dehydratase [Campylobacteraceae bacterium 4484_166]|nr:MAG: type II 3-dehydroquinate dehydratase [Campylobacteraceae bacterium 4484_166]